jgi:hypothetical protein
MERCRSEGGSDQLLENRDLCSYAHINYLGVSRNAHMEGKYQSRERVGSDKANKEDTMRVR